MTTINFSELGLADPIQRALNDRNHVIPTPIQAKAIPQLLAGKDILGIAQTGTGKTASFTLPMLSLLARGRARARMPRSLVLCPTRELAAQVAEIMQTIPRTFALVTMRSVSQEDLVDYTYQVKLSLEADAARLMAALDRLEGVRGLTFMNHTSTVEV